MDKITYMQECHDLFDSQGNAHLAYAKRWKSKLKQQSTLSSYHTTKRAQLQTVVNTHQKHAEVISSQCQAMQQVISDFSEQVDRLYPSGKHIRAQEMKLAYKTARAPLQLAEDKLKSLQNKEERAAGALHDANVQCENLQFDAPDNASKQSRAQENQKERQNALKFAQDNVVQAKGDLAEEKIVYRQKAQEIFQLCQSLEEKRFDLIRETLIAFARAVHSSDYTNELDSIYDGLVSKIEKEQNSVEDLKFWSRTYGVDKVTTSDTDEKAASTTSSTTATPQVNQSDNPIKDAGPSPVKPKIKRNNSKTPRSTGEN